VGSPPVGPSQTKQALPLEASLPGATIAFSHIWTTALAQAETLTAQRLRNTKGLVLPLPDAKPQAESRPNDSAATGIFSSEKTDPLPLLLSFNATPIAAPETGASTTKNDAASRSLSVSAAGQEDSEEAPPSTSAPVAFTAKFKTDASGAAPDPDSAASPTLSRSATAVASGDAEVMRPPVANQSIASGLPASDSNLIPAAGAPIQALTSSQKIASPLSAEPTEATTETPASAPQPMKEIAFQLPGARGVEVRLTERAGEVRMDVRTGDAALTQDLRGNLHDLLSGLERKGISAEVTHPGDHATAPAARSAESGAFKDQTPGGQGGAFDRQPQQRNRQPGQPPEPLASKARASAWSAQANLSFEKEK